MDSKRSSAIKSGPKGQKHRERDARQRQQEDRVDRRQSDDQIDAEAGEVVREIAIQEATLLEEEIRRIPAVEDDLIDDPDRIEGPDDDGGELRRGVEEGVDDERCCRATADSAQPKMTASMMIRFTPAIKGSSICPVSCRYPQTIT